MCKDVDNLIKAFTTYVRPMLEYCSPVWSPVSSNLGNYVESVQRRFTKRLPRFCSYGYNERCARLGIERLELRRLHTDLIMCFKIVHGLVALQSDSCFTIDHAHISRGHSFKLFLPQSRVNCIKYFFAIRVNNAWNSLSNEIVSTNQLSLFENRLRQVDIRKFMVESCSVRSIVLCCVFLCILCSLFY